MELTPEGFRKLVRSGGTYKEFCRFSGIDRTTIWRYMNGQTKITIDAFKKAIEFSER